MALSGEDQGDAFVQDSGWKGVGPRHSTSVSPKATTATVLFLPRALEPTGEPLGDVRQHSGEQQRLI